MHFFEIKLFRSRERKNKKHFNRDLVLHKSKAVKVKWILLSALVIKDKNKNCGEQHRRTKQLGDIIKRRPYLGKTTNEQKLFTGERF
jgi:hypothetical protein